MEEDDVTDYHLDKAVGDRGLAGEPDRDLDRDLAEEVGKDLGKEVDKDLGKEAGKEAGKMVGISGKGRDIFPG